MTDNAVHDAAPSARDLEVDSEATSDQDGPDQAVDRAATRRALALPAGRMVFHPGPLRFAVIRRSSGHPVSAASRTGDNALGRARDLAEVARALRIEAARARQVERVELPRDDRHDRTEPLGRPGRAGGPASARGRAPGRRPRRSSARRRAHRAGGPAARRGRRRARPDRTTARTGTPGSTRASGPCWKSAAEYGSAKTRASSLSLSAHSRAVAYSYPRAMTSARVVAAWSRAIALDLGLEVEARGQRVGDRGDGGAVGRVVGQRRRQQRDREQLGRVGLGRGDRPFRAGAEGDRPVRGGRQRRVGLVGDRDRRGALARGPRR